MDDMSRTRTEILFHAREVGQMWTAASSSTRAKLAELDPLLHDAIDALADLTERTTPREDC